MAVTGSLSWRSRYSAAAEASSRQAGLFDRLDDDDEGAGAAARQTNESTICCVPRPTIADPELIGGCGWKLGFEARRLGGRRTTEPVNGLTRIAELTDICRRPRWLTGLRIIGAVGPLHATPGSFSRKQGRAHDDDVAKIDRVVIGFGSLVLEIDGRDL